MGMAIMVLGVLVALVGWVWLLAMAVERGRFWFLLIFCFGWLGALLLIAAHAKKWREFLVPVGLWYGGLLGITIGSAISPLPGGDPPPPIESTATPQSPESEFEVEADGPSPEDLRVKAYLEFHETLRACSTVTKRLGLLERWREEGFDAVDGAWRDLVESLADGPSSEALELAQLAEAERLGPANEAIVYVLPKVRPRVRRGLLARFANATDAEREACLEALSKTNDLDDPAILEAYLVLGVVTAYRVSRMIRSMGLGWTEQPVLSKALRERAQEKPAFVEALLADGDPRVRAFGCSLVELLPADGDEGLGKVLPLLRDTTSEVRLAAADALALLAKPRASWGLARALAREGDANVRERLLAALAALDPEPTLGLILRLQRRDAAADQRGAALALQAFAPALVVEPLNRALAAKEETVVEAGLLSLLALARGGDSQALAPCLEAVAALDPNGGLAELRAEVLAVLESDR